MRDRHMGSGAGRRACAALWLVTLALVLAAAPLAAVEARIAVVDMQRALNECEAGKRAKDQVKAKFEHSQNQLKKQREDLDRRNLEKDLESRGLEFKRKYEDFQRDLKETDAELTKSIVQELYELVRDYGEKHEIGRA